MKVTILTESELRALVEIDLESIAAIEEAFTWLARGRVTMPPIMHIQVPEYRGDVDIKAAYVKGLESFAVKMGAGFFDNRRLGLPSSPAMMVVLSARTGFAEAILLDNAYLTDVRTGAAGGVAARHLAPQAVDTAGVIGTGVQGEYQMCSLKLVRDYRRLLAYDRDRQRLAQYVTSMRTRLAIEVVAAESARQVVEQSQVVVTCTPSRTPYLEPGWLHPGLHITAMGADLPEKGELFPEVLARADRLVCDRKTQSFTLGELHHALEAGVLSETSPVTELGEITAGLKPGRRTPDEITICDLSGTGVQDTAIALMALRKASVAHSGIAVDIGFD